MLSWGSFGPLARPCLEPGLDRQLESRTAVLRRSYQSAGLKAGYAAVVGHTLVARVKSLEHTVQSVDFPLCQLHFAGLPSLGFVLWVIEINE